MELTEKSFLERLNKIKQLSSENGEEWRELCDRLKEKGTEYCVVFPLFEVMLGFDPLEDVKMEISSTKQNNQRFDFVIKSKDEEYSLLIEAKSMSEPLSGKYERQLMNYMDTNPEYPWGILTNGLDWKFFVRKKYLEKKFNEGNPLSYIKEKVINLLTLNLNDDFFVKIMKGMSKGNLSTFWYNCANFSCSVMTGGTRIRSIINDTEANNNLRDKIRREVEIKFGEYADAIMNAVMKEGDEVICKNDFLQMSFVLDAGGCLILQPEKTNVIDFMKFTEINKDAPTVLASWMGSENPFTDRSQIVLGLTGGQRFTATLRDLFPFNPPPPERRQINRNNHSDGNTQP